jgi:hypothetical protein
MSHLDPLQSLALLSEAARVTRHDGSVVFNVDLMETEELRARAVVDALESARTGFFGASRPRPYCETQIRTLCLAAGLASVGVEYPNRADRTDRVPAVVVAQPETGGGDQ